MGVTLYHFPPSPTSRAVLMVCKTLGIDVEVKIVDLFAKEQLKPDFLKINHQHCLPTIVDGDFTLWESRAIVAYLVNTYGKDDSLYPKDPKHRALVDQKLQFDCGSFYPKVRAFFFPVLFFGTTEISKDTKVAFKEVLGVLETFLESSEFVAGKEITVADIALVASLSSVLALGWDLSPFKKVSMWFTKCKLAIPGYNEANHFGAEILASNVIRKLPAGHI